MSVQSILFPLTSPYDLARSNSLLLSTQWLSSLIASMAEYYETMALIQRQTWIYCLMRYPDQIKVTYYAVYIQTE